MGLHIFLNLTLMIYGKWIPRNYCFGQKELSRSKNGVRMNNG